MLSSATVIGGFKWDAIVLTGDESDEWTDQLPTNETWTEQAIR